MNRKQFLVLVVLVILFGGAGLLVHQRQSASWTAGGAGARRKLLENLPVDDVAAIVIRSGTNELDLVKKENLWRVAQRGDYPASYSEISGFLLKAADLKAAQIEEIGPSQLGRFNLLPPGPGTNTGVLVELRDQGGKAIQSLLLGKPHLRKAAPGSPAGEGGDGGWPDGRFLMVGTNAQSVAVISDPLGNMEVKPEQWLNKDFFKVEKIRAVSVVFPASTNSWSVTRETESGEWKLADATPDEKLDTSKVSSLNYALNAPTFNDVLPADAKPEPPGMEKPTVVTLDTFDGFVYTLKIGEKTNDNCLLRVSIAANLPGVRAPGKDEKPEDKDKLDKEFNEKQKKLAEKLAREKGFEKWTYEVSNWTVDSLLKARSDLLAGKPAEPKPEEPKPEESQAEQKKSSD